MLYVIVFVVILVVIHLIRFFLALSKDKDDLQAQSLSEKFSLIVNLINSAAFNGQGNITVLDKTEFNLYQEGQNQIIKFFYSTGNLAITWKYKYFQKEVVHELKFDNVRNLSIFEQQKIAETMITEMKDIIKQHQMNVISSIQ